LDDGDGAIVRIEVPQEDWARPFAAEIRKICEAHDLVADFGTSALDTVLCAISVPISNIWVEWASAKPARIASLLLDGLGVQDRSILDFELIGPRSSRALRRDVDDL
jgi:hypothetical protein